MSTRADRDLELLQGTRGWITFEDGTSENNRRAKYYRLPPKGRQQLELEISRWETFARAIARILRPAARE